MKERPIIKLELTTTDKIFELLGWLLIVAVWWLTFKNYSNLPDTIPTHYNGAGQADGFGGKTSIFTMPFNATISFIGLTVLNKFPHIFNYPTNITSENAFRQYTNATRLIRSVKLIIVFIFGLVTFNTVQTAKGEADGLGVWFTPITMGLIFIPLIYYIVRSVKNKQ